MKIVKNGVKKTGKQILLCKDCRLQFQWEYSYKGADKAIKEKLVKMLLRGSGVRDCAAVLNVSFSCVLGTILKEGSGLQIQPKHLYYKRLQLDMSSGLM